jgi:hypothetical protein
VTFAYISVTVTGVGINKLRKKFQRSASPHEKCLEGPDDSRFYPDRDPTRRPVKVRNGYCGLSNRQTARLRPKTMLRIACSVAYDIVQSRSSRKSMMLRHHAGCSANQSIASKVSHYVQTHTKTKQTDE